MSAEPRVFYVTVVQVTILSEHPYDPDKELDQIFEDITVGDCNGDTTTTLSNEKVNAATAARMLLGSGSDPEFFGIDEAGNDVPRAGSGDDEDDD
jgi:hypothetical protein